MTVRDEEIRVGDSTDVINFQVRLTHLGPVFNDNQVNEDGTLDGFNNEDPLVMHWTALQEVGSISQSLALLQSAANWDEFRTALTFWDSPSQNFVFADTQGNIGYQTPGLMPIRAEGHMGDLPVDGTTDQYEWRGYVPFEYLPSVWNPERGYIATANQALVPMEYYESLRVALGEKFGEDSNYVFGLQWSVGYRGQRIVDMLEATEQHSAETIAQIQGDNHWGFAEDIAPALQSIDFGELNDERDWMLEWDYQMHMDSPQGALFGLFWKNLVTGIFDDEMIRANLDPVSGGGYEMWSVFLMMSEPDDAWWDNVDTETTETRDGIVIRAFTDAYAEATERLGADRATWRWGALHTSTFISNPLGLSGVGLIEDFVNRGPVATSGGSEIVNATSWNKDLTVSAVPSMRMILDVGNFANSQTIHTTGQSGHPASAQYGNFIEAWRMIEFHPMLWTREQVDADAQARLILNP
jgi:penicillin G amidase